MTTIDHSNTGAVVRADLVAAQNRAWQRIGTPGTWWPAATRLAIAAEARVANACRLCARRKAALSPYSEDGVHDGHGNLPTAVTEIVHRIVTDPGRLTQSWHESVIGGDLNPAQYVEMVSVVATVVMIDTFARAVGAEPPPLPDMQTGDPTHYTPDGACDLGAWVPMLGFDGHGAAESDLFANGAISNIRASLTLVPDEARNFNDLVNHHYAARPTPPDFFATERSITHPQIELLAARVSALNGCFY